MRHGIEHRIERGGRSPVTLSPMTLTDRIKAEARTLGFAGTAIVPVTPPASHGFYRDWIAAGYGGAMGYLERHLPLKQDPATLLPGAQSLIVLTMNYNPPALRNDGPPALRNCGPPPPRPPQDGGPRGRVARYAWGQDYHRVLGSKLERLARELDAWVRMETGRPLGWRSFVDSGPLMEREFAARGGLGWVGKNANLIHWEHGSWLVIGELMVDVALDPDAPRLAGASGKPTALTPREPGPAALLPLRESCGTCTACIEACPTQAIVADKTVDARRCISYLTIELKGPIPADLRGGLGDWVFGCDVCQEVCPWNRGAPVSDVAEFGGTASAAFPSLPDLLSLDDAAFRTRFQGTPLLRPRRRGLLRNAAIALGNWLGRGHGDGAAGTQAVAALHRALADSEPWVRGAAAWALGQSRGAAARRQLQSALESETDSTVRQELTAALAAWPVPDQPEEMQ
jgi:epoxyqueuosine reductase